MERLKVTMYLQTTSGPDLMLDDLQNHIEHRLHRMVFKVDDTTLRVRKVHVVGSLE